MNKLIAGALAAVTLVGSAAVAAAPSTAEAQPYYGRGGYGYGPGRHVGPRRYYGARRYYGPRRYGWNRGYAYRPYRYGWNGPRYGHRRGYGPGYGYYGPGRW